jgi:hypothetical protein
LIADGVGKPIDMKKNKPIYGRSQGARLQDMSEESTSRIKDAESVRAVKKIKYKKTKISQTTIKSWPRTIAQLTTFIAICYYMAKNTPVGQSMTQNISDRFSALTKNASKMREDIDPTKLSQQQQKKSDDRFDDAWKQACGKDKDC